MPLNPQTGIETLTFCGICGFVHRCSYRPSLGSLAPLPVEFVVLRPLLLEPFAEVELEVAEPCVVIVTTKEMRQE